MYTNENVIRAFELWYADMYAQPEDYAGSTWEDFSAKEQAEFFITLLQQVKESE